MSLVLLAPPHTIFPRLPPFHPPPCLIFLFLSALCLPITIYSIHLSWRILPSPLVLYSLYKLCDYMYFSMPIEGIKADIHI